MPEVKISKQNSSRLAGEVNRLFSLYRPYVGDRQPMAGGAQGLLMKCQAYPKPVHTSNSVGCCQNTPSTFKFEYELTDFNPILKPCSACSQLEQLPTDVVLYIFAYLSFDDLCSACLVNKSWNWLANDEYLWKFMLERDSNRWRQIYYDRNPEIYRKVCTDLSSKRIYVKCRERFSHNYANLLTGGSKEVNNPLSSLFSMILPGASNSKPRVLMFGPGLESKTSKIVRSMLTDQCMNESARFKVTGLVPGGFSGVGSGISMRFEDRAFNLVVLYSNTKSIRQHLSAEDRVRDNKLFVHHQEQIRNDSVTATGSIHVRDGYEVTAAVQELCKNSHAFVFVVDASQCAREISYAQAELSAMVCELWSPAFAPLLVLACRRNCAPKQALSSMAVVKALRLGRLNKKWMTQSAEVESLDGVRSGIRWLLSQI